jgi:oxalate decarboxylase
MAKHFFNLRSLKPQKSSAEGSKTLVGKNEVSSLEGISLESLKLSHGCASEPCWHPNAHKIGYCLKGSAIVSILAPHSQDLFTVSEGDVFFIPKGSFHYLENNGEGESLIVSALSHHHPEELTVTKALRSLSDIVLADTLGMSNDFFETLKNSKQSSSFVKNSFKKATPDISSHFKFKIGASNNYLTTKGGYLKAATLQNLPVIQDLGIFTFGLNQNGIVEPHWHTNAGELIYVVRGHVRITILSADGSLDAADLKAGEGGFAPASYFHSIENLDRDEADIIAFFSHADPDYIGFGQAVGTCSHELLAGVFNVPLKNFDHFNPPKSPLVIAGG